VTASREHLHLLLGLFLGLLFFVNLGSYGLLEDNEARFLEIAWEMKESGDLVVPKLNYISHFHKPPATFWIESLSLKMLGDSEAAARIPVVLASIATILLTSFFFTDSRKKVLVALILASNPEFWLLSRTVLTDMYLCLTVTACMVSAYVLLQKESPTAAAAFWTSAALSGLVKGPVGLTIVALALVTLNLWNRVSGRQSVPWKHWMGWRGLALFGLITLPWYVAVCLRFPHLLNYFVEFQTVQRVATEVHGRGGPLWFYLPVLLIGFLPWSLALPQALYHAARRADLLDRLLAAWFLPPLVLFSLSGSKLPTYLLPLFPAMALLVARYLKARQARGTTTNYLAGSGLVLGSAVVVYCWGKLPPELLPGRSSILMSGIALGFSSGLVLALRRFRSSATCEGFVGIAFGGFLIALSFGLNSCDSAYSARRLALELKPRVTNNTTVAELSDHLHGLPYYLGRRIVQVSYPRETQFERKDSVSPYLYDDLNDFMTAHKDDEHTIMILRDSDYDPASFPGWEVVYRGRWMALERLQPTTLGTK